VVIIKLIRILAVLNQIQLLNTMKKISKLIASISLSLLAFGAFGQTEFTTDLGFKPVVAHVNGGANLPLKRGSIAQPAAKTLYYGFLDYVYPDSLLYNGTYDKWYAQIINTRYVPADTGKPLRNQPLLHEAAVAFDTTFDANSMTGYPQKTLSNMTVDSIYVLFGHQNVSKKNDTIVVQINSVDANGAPTATALYTKTIITDTGMSYQNNWNYGYFLMLTPNLSLGSATRFAISLQYFGSKLDTCAFYYGFPAFTGCTFNLADTTLFGLKYKGMRANSFTSGWSYFASPKGSSQFTFPSVTNGEGITYNCKPPGMIYWQDIAMYAAVSFNSTLGVNNITESGLSVGQNYPNPFNKQTQITYSLTKSSEVTFSVYDMTGRTIATNNYGSVAPGQHVINLSANTFTPGIYFYTFNVNGSTVTKKMVITQ